MDGTPRTSITMEEIVKLVNKPSPVIFDIGANNGNTSAAFLKYFPSAKIYAFEPDPRAAAKCARRLAGTSAVLTTAAVSDHNGTSRFWMSDSKNQTDPEKNHDKSGSLLQPTGHIKKYSGVKFDRTIEVSVVRLDDWCADLGIDSVDFIWADVQGGEEKLIQGAQQVLHNTRFFYTEFSNQELYLGQPSLEKIKNLLPFMRVVEIFKDDVLFERI